MPYLFDGYNLLRMLQKMEEFASFTDVQMCRALSDYLKAVRDHGHVIFDGIGPSDKSAFGGMPCLEVLFSGDKTDADSVIEQKIQDNTAPKSLVVISSDRRVQASAAKRKAAPVRADVFWQKLLSQLEKERKRPAPEPFQKRHGLTDHETDLWLRRFELDQ
ncbi:MAG: NYN domain-containing protein [Planctomycetaceae bacterium]|nr:NYN domain-containing protein [Planctomycetaceae bacterium]